MRGSWWGTSVQILPAATVSDQRSAYYLWVRASNDGGYDSAEDQQTANFSADGTTSIFVSITESLSLTDTAPVNYTTSLQVSDSIDLTDIAEISVTRTTVQEDLILSEVATASGDVNLSITETITLSEKFELSVPGDASESLSFSDEASATVHPSYHESVADTLSLTHSASNTIAIGNLDVAKVENLAVSDLASCFIDHYVDQSELLTTTDTQVNPDTLEITTVQTGLRASVKMPREIIESVADHIALSEARTNWVLGGGGIVESVTDTLSLDDSGQRSITASPKDSLATTDLAAAFIAYMASDKLTLSDTATALLEAGVSISETLSLKTTIASVLIGHRTGHRGSIHCRD